MAIYRTIQLSFWTDEKILDEFTPEDKYFYLYLFTNPQTNLCGCYELGWTSTIGQLGYSKDTVLRLLDRFENVHKVIMYSKETKEVLLLNWHKYNWTTSARFLISLRKEIETVKNDSFKTRLQTLFNQYLSNALSNKDIKEKELEMLKKIEFFEIQGEVNIPYQYGIDTTVTVTDTVIDNNNNSNNKDIDKENIRIIIDYLNSVLGTSYTYKNKDTNSRINARLKEGFSIDDFKLIIDDKAKKWKSDPKMKLYLRPSTLFAPGHFEEYLNEAKMSSGTGGSAKPKSDWDGLAARLDKEAVDKLSSMNYEDYGDFN